MTEVKNKVNSETFQATSLPSASLPVPFLLSLLSPLLTLSPPLSPNLMQRDDLANPRLLVGCDTPPPFLLPLVQQIRGCSICLCVLCTYIHTDTLPYLQLCGMLLDTHFCPIHIFPILLSYLTHYYYFPYSHCACIFPRMHTTLHVHGAVHACPYHTYPCVLFIPAHIHIPAFIPHVVSFSHTHLFLYISTFLYICTFVFPLMRTL